MGPHSLSHVTGVTCSYLNEKVCAECLVHAQCWLQIFPTFRELQFLFCFSLMKLQFDLPVLFLVAEMHFLLFKSAQM
jgi:hypothetical protein